MSYYRPKKKERAKTGESLVDLTLDDQNDQLGAAESSKGRRKKSKFTL